MNCTEMKQTESSLNWTERNSRELKGIQGSCPHVKWSELKWNELIGNELKCTDISWNRNKQNEVKFRWNKFSALQWTEMNCTEMKWTEPKWSDLIRTELDFRWTEMNFAHFCLRWTILRMNKNGWIELYWTKVNFRVLALELRWIFVEFNRKELD